MRTIIILLCLTGLFIPLRAQDGKISVRTMAITPGEFPPLWAMDSTTAVKLEFATVQPSDPFELAAGSHLSISRGELDEKGKPRDTAPTSLKLPEGKEILLLAAIMDSKVRFFPVRDAPASGKYTDWFVINMTSKQVGVQVGAGSKVVPFKSGECKPLAIDAPAGEGAAVVMAANDKGKWDKFYSTYWPVHGNKRCVILLVQIGEKIEARQILEELDRKIVKLQSSRAGGTAAAP